MYKLGVFNKSSTTPKDASKKVNLSINDTTTIDSNIINNDKIKIENSNSEVAIINNDGKIEAKSNGITTITFKDENENIIEKIEIIVDSNDQTNDETINPKPKDKETTNQQETENKDTDNIINQEDQNSTNNSNSTIEIESITLNKKSTTLIVNKSETITATISPTNTTDKKIEWSSSNTNVAIVNNGKITAKGVGTAKIIAKCGNKTASLDITVYSNTKDRIEVYFLNVINSPSLNIQEDEDTGGESVILKTLDNKYILYDTGLEKNEIYNMIYNKLKELQGTSNVTLDYLIVSHFDKDHVGNAKRIINSNKITVKNIVLKYEEVLWGKVTSGKEQYKGIIESAIKEKVKIYTSANMTASKMQSLMNKSVEFTRLSKEGYKINVGDYLSMYFYNTDDIYKNYNSSDCITGTLIKYNSKWRDTTEYVKTDDGQYIYYDNTSGQFPGNSKLKTTKVFKEVIGSNRYFSYFYAYKAGTKNACRANGNSIAVMFSVKVENSPYKYIYMPGDLENIGYDIFPTKIDGYDSPIYGNSGSYIYYEDKIKFDETKQRIFGGYKRVRVASETDVAKNIASSSAFKNKLQNIVIYQQSHHGFNNGKDAIDILGLNRSGVYAIATATGSFTKTSSFLRLVSYYYSLGKVPSNYKLNTSNGKNGIKCNIAYNATVKCIDY